MKVTLPAYPFSRLTGRVVFSVLLVLIHLKVSAQIITTVAGSNSKGDGGPATDANLFNPASVAVDASGNLFIADQWHNRIRKVTPDGIITTVAGNGTYGFSGDGGPATNASLSAPGSVCLDGHGNIFFAEATSYRIRKISPEGIISTVAGNGVEGFSGDGGPATNASLQYPLSVAVNKDGALFIADFGSSRVRKVAPDGIISTVAGTVLAGYYGEGIPAVDAYLYNPTGVTVDNQGNLFINDSGNRRIRKVDANGIISTVAGNGISGFSGDGGPATSASINYSQRVAVDDNGNLFIPDESGNRIRRVSADGIITTIIGSGQEGFSGDGGPAINAKLFNPTDVAIDRSGNLFVADQYNYRIRKVNNKGLITTIVGNGTRNFGGDGGLATRATVSDLYDVLADGSGNLYIPDRDNHRIRKVTSDGIIKTIAGNGTAAYTGDGGLAADAALRWPTSLAQDKSGNLFVVDQANGRVRKISTNGIITTVAGNGEYGFSGDGGPATSAMLNSPYGIAVDQNGAIYIADLGNARVRKVTPDGIITTVAGNGIPNHREDGGPAIRSGVGYPSGVAVDKKGNLFIVDSWTNRVRKVDSRGIITTVAGNGEYGFSGDGGPATKAKLATPLMVAVDDDGNLYIADQFNNRIRKVSSDGIITTVAGNGLQGYGGDGSLATDASLDHPSSVSLDGNGNLLIADMNNKRIRRVSSVTSVTGSFDGHLYGADCSSFQGWVWDQKKPNTPITIDILDGTTTLATMLADEFRQDLMQAGKGNGRHAFRFTIPGALKDGLPHRLSARVTGGTFTLKSSPKILTCQPTVPPVNQPPVAPSIAGMSAQVGILFSSGALPTFKDPEGRPLTYTLTGLPEGLAFSSNRIISGTPTVAGSFTLTYAATDPQGAMTTVSILLTVNPASATVSGNFEGFLDTVDCNTIRGWAWDRNKPNTPVTVEFYTNNTVWGSTLASTYRDDLKTAGKGNGAHAYSFQVPVALKGTGSHLIYGRVQGSTYILKTSGKLLNCPLSTRLSAEQTQKLQAVLVGNPVAHQIQLKILGAEGQLVRVVVTDLTGRIINESAIEKANAIEERTLSVSKAAAGLLLLHVSTRDESVTVKALKVK